MLDDASQAELEHHQAVVNGLRLHWVQAGVGQPVLLLHGFPQYWGAWRHQIGPLAANYRVIAPDLRGYNLSEKPPGIRNYRLQELTADVAALIEHVGGRAHVVGHDWGGVIAWVVAARYPQLVQRLVIANAPHPDAYRALAARHPQQLLRSWYALALSVPLLPEALTRASRFAWLRSILRGQPSRPGAFTPEDVEAHVRAMAQPGALEAAINYYRAALLHGIYPDGAPLRVAARTLVLWGDRDPYLLPGLAEAVAPWAPDLRVRHYPTASHWLMADEPEAFTEAVTEFLAS